MTQKDFNFRGKGLIIVRTTKNKNCFLLEDLRFLFKIT